MIKWGHEGVYFSVEYGGRCNYRASVMKTGDLEKEPGRETNQRWGSCFHGIQIQTGADKGRNILEGRIVEKPFHLSTSEVGLGWEE